MNVSKKSRRTIVMVVETITIIGVAIASIMMRQFLTPFERGFFKNDESIMYPFKSSSVTNVMLYTVGFLGNSAVILLGELLTLRFRKRNPNLEMHCIPWSKWGSNCYKLLCCFALGAAMTHLLTNLQKYSVGRLRPHFFSVCKPDFSLLNNTSGYITADICTGESKALIKEARLSYPSGHSSISMYCAVFLMLYLYKRYTWRNVVLIRPLLQLAAFCLGLYTCLSRISDYKHHWSDVLAGGFLGSVMAFLSIFKINYFFKDEEKSENKTSVHRGTFMDFHLDQNAEFLPAEPFDVVNCP